MQLINLCIYDSYRYYRKAVGVVFVYDIAKRTTFDNIDKWLKEARNFTDDDVILMLVGNKTDLRHLRAVSSHEARSYAGILWVQLYIMVYVYIEIEYICVEFKDVTFRINQISLFLLFLCIIYFCREKQHVVYRDISTGLYPR